MLQENVRAKRDGEEPTNFTQASWDAMPEDKYGYKLYIVKDELPLLTATKKTIEVTIDPYSEDATIPPQLKKVTTKKATTKKAKKNENT